MKKGISAILACILTICLAACGGGGGSSSTNSTPTPTQSFGSLQQIAQQAVDDGVDGIWIYLERPGQAPLWVAAGVEDVSQSRAARTTSLFKIASISKMFIATAASMLVDEQTLSLDDTLAAWLPELTFRIDNAEAITIRNLLQHRSGVPDFDSHGGFSWQDSHTNWDATLAHALDLPADFAPDSRYSYSNSNYLLLGMILDRALGFSHHDYVAQQIFHPLAMHNTYSTLSDANLQDMAHGYWQGTDRLRQDYAIPGGSMISTAEDTAIFIRALATGELLSDSAQEIYTSVYGTGHSGWLPGYQSVARYLQNEDTVVIQFVNTTGDNSESIADVSFQRILNWM